MRNQGRTRLINTMLTGARNPMDKIVSAIRMTSRLSRLGGLAERLNVLAITGGATAEEAESLERGVVEAVSNVIKHGYGGRSNMEMKLVVTCTPEGMRIDLYDSGPAIPPAVVATMRGCRQWDPSDRLPETGDGLPTIGICFDAVTYNRRWGVNRLRMTKRLGCSAGFATGGGDDAARGATPVTAAGPAIAVQAG